MKSQFSKMGGIVKKLGATVAAAFSVRAIVNFAKEAINLGSDLQEVQNVVDVTFGDLNSQINAFAKNAITQFGLSELSAKQYASTLGAIFKSSGFSVEQAAAMSQTLTGLAGDIASFYNLTSDEAFSKLRGGITGETEPLKQLGINLSAANLEAYALSQGITKSYDAMSQQEKMILRYNYILSVTADAQGDFARTSESWANQTRILSEQFNSIKATIGQGLINAFTPVIKVINTVLIGLQKLANAFAQFTSLLFGNAGGSMSSGAGSVANSFGAAADSAEDMAAATGAAAKAAKILSGLDEINTFSSGKGGGGGGATGSDLFTDINLNESLSNALSLDDNFSKKIANAVEKVRAVIEQLRDIDLTPLKSTFISLGNNISDFGSIAKKSLDFVWNKLLLPLSKWTIEKAAPATVSALSNAFDMLNSILEPVIDGFIELFDWLQPVFDFIGDHVIDVINLFGDAFSKVAQVFKEKGGKIREIFSMVGETISAVWNLISPVLDYFKEKFNNVFGRISTIVADTIGYAIDLLHGLLEFITGVFTGDWERAWEGVKEIFSTIWDKVVGIFAGIKTRIISAINNNLILPFNMFIKKIIDGINAVFAGIENIGSKIGLGKYVNIGRVRMVSIPYLAKGAVIPPNAPFMAMLGDQKHGTNIEAPADLISQILAAELDKREGGGVYNVNLMVNGRTILKAVLDEAKLQQSRTGKNPLLLY